MKKLITILGLALLLVGTPALHAYNYAGWQFHGFWSEAYFRTDENNYFGTSSDGAWHSEAAVSATHWLTENTRVGVQFYTFELGHYGSLSDPQIDWAYIDYRPEDYFGVRYGKVKLPSGLYNTSLDLDMSRVYAFLPQGIYETAYRDFAASALGVNFYGTLQTQNKGSFDYELVVGKTDYSSGDGMNESLSQNGTFRVHGSDSEYVGVGQIIWNTPIEGLRIGGSVLYLRGWEYRGPFKSASEFSMMPPPTNAMAGLAGLLEGADTTLYFPEVLEGRIGVEYLWKKWTFAAELSRQGGRYSTTVEDPDASLGGEDLTGGREYPLNIASFYVAASREISDKLSVGGYYSAYYGDLNDTDGSKLAAAGADSFAAYQKDLTLAVRYDISDNWIVKLEGHLINGTAQLRNLYDNTPWQDRDRYWGMVVVKSTVYF